MEEEKEQVPKRESDLWGRGVLEGIGEGIVFAAALAFINSLSPFKDQFSSDDMKVGALALISLGFFLAEHTGKPTEIKFVERWGYFFGAMLIGLLALFFDPYVGFFCIILFSSLTFGAWLKMRWLKSNAARRVR